MASRFWVGGTGTWDSSTTTHWSASTGGAGGATAPVGGDTVTFDASSGGGTVTVDTTINGLSFAVFTMTAFTGTVDFSVNNPSTTYTTSFSCGGSGSASVLKMGSGTFTLTGNNGNVWNASSTNFTLTAGTSTIVFSGAPTGNINFVTGGSGLTYNNVTFTPTYSTAVGIYYQIAAALTVNTLTLTAPCNARFSGAVVVNTALNATGTSSNQLLMFAVNTQLGFTVPVSTTINWAAIDGFAFVNSPTANNSFDLKGNSGITINAPTGGTAGAKVFGS